MNASATRINEIHETGISRSNADGGDYTVERIDDDMICSECHCYVTEVDLDAYHCLEHGIIYA